MEQLAHNEERIKEFVQMPQLLNIKWVPLDVIELTYISLVNRKEMTAIENLERVEKERLWRLVTKWVEGPQAHKIRCTRVLYFIEQLQGKKING